MFSKRNILTLFLIIIPLLLIGVSNYFFAASSYHLIIDPETHERLGRYWVGDIDGVLMALVMCVFVILLWIPAARFGWIDKMIEKLTSSFEHLIQDIKINKKKYLLRICIIVLILIFAVIIEIIFFASGILGHTVRRIFFFATGGLSAYIIILLRGKPDKLFLSLSLVIGFMYVITHPMLFFGFDNEMHYAWIVEESFIRNVSVVESDLILARTFQMGHFGWLPSGEDNAVIYSFPKAEETLTWTGQQSSRLFYTRLAHIPMGLILYFGRSLALNPNIILWMIMYGSHLLYTITVYFAIRRLNSGKYLMAAIALVPLTFLVTTSLGYDGWIKAFILLGLAYFFYELQTPDKKVKLKSIIIIIGALLLGLAPRAVYFPLLLILYCLRKEKFETLKGYRWYIAAVTGAIMFVLATLLIPYITTSGAEYHDPRAGENIDSIGQIMFILQNPLEYTGILLNFLKDYMNIFRSEKFISWYISYEYLSFPNLTILLLFFIALTDRSEKDKFTSSIWLKAFVAFLIFSTVAIYTTALYISFTGVGSPVIEGVQRRYMIQLLFLFFYIIFNMKIMYKLNKTVQAGICRLKLENKLNENTYSMIVFGIMSLVLLNGEWNTFLL